MERMRSYADAERAANELMERMALGQQIEGNCFKIRKEFNDYTGSHHFKVSGPCEHIQDFGKAWDMSLEEIDSLELSMSEGALAHFVLFPERKAINDALPVIERQLAAAEHALFARL